MLDDIVMSKATRDRLDQICTGTARARARGAPLRHVMVYGPAGTGKSLVARALGTSVDGLPFALMSGSDLAPLGKHGPSELRKILTWASRSRSGAMLIIDEAEAALGSRLRAGGDFDDDDGGAAGGKSEGFARDALNVLLSMTGTASCDLMLVLTTSNPQALDEAVLDRMDELIGMELPKAAERRRILATAFEKRFREEGVGEGGGGGLWVKLTKSKDSRALLAKGFGQVSHALDRLSADDRTKGCSGRELEKMIQAVLTNVYGSVEGDGTLSKEIWERVTSGYCEELKEKRKLTNVEVKNQGAGEGAGEGAGKGAGRGGGEEGREASTAVGVQQERSGGSDMPKSPKHKHWSEPELCLE